MAQRTRRVAVALGSNLGDRQGNIAAALRRIRTFVDIGRISPTYETVPVGYTNQPDFVNLACTGKTALSARELRDALRSVERQVGRASGIPLGPRAIDLDLLLYEDLVLDDEDLSIPHPRMRSRAFVLLPLADIAPDWIDPVTHKTVRELAQAVDPSGVRRQRGDLLARLRHDVQDARPSVPLALNRAGVTGIKTLVNLPDNRGRNRPVTVTFDVYADLTPSRSGVHMSRFSQDLEDALAELGSTVGADPTATSLDKVALELAERVVESQRADMAEVDARAEIALERHTPATGIATLEFYTVIAKAVVAQDHRRRIIGVQADGITACPCAQGLVADASRERLQAEGFDEDQIGRILSTIPVATHNQRSRGTLLVGGERNVDVATLAEIVEQSMSSETYDLLKRPDELFVVNKAHFAPRFVEDAVREMLAYVHDVFEDFPDETFVLVRQVNFESIHKHDAVAESCATLGELRRELRGEPDVTHTTLEQWLHPNALVAGRPEVAPRAGRP